VNGHEFLRKLNQLAKEKKLAVVHEKAHGKGSHGRVYFGTSYTTLKDPKKEIGPGLLSKMCRDLGIKPNEL
jgi:predicted RNA binding protein YcfA (HicA-like mRNA interferase family)